MKSDTLHTAYKSMGDLAPITAIWVCAVHGYAGERRSWEHLPDYDSMLGACFGPDSCTPTLILIEDIVNAIPALTRGY